MVLLRRVLGVSCATPIRGATPPLINTVAVRPRFSVVIPVHNRADVVGRAVASVLAQTFASVEVVVVDDGSTDDSVAAARAVADGRVQVLRQDHSGVAAARASGMRRAHGTWVLFLDPDDEVAPGWLARFGRLIDSTGAGFVSCAGDQHYLDGTLTTFAPVTLPAGARIGDPQSAATVKVCFRAGAFATTRERLHRVGAFAGPLGHGGPSDSSPSDGPNHGCSTLRSTVHSAGTGTLDVDDRDHSCLDPSTFDPDAVRLDVLGPDDGGHESSTSDREHISAPDLDLAEIGSRVVATVLADGVPVVHTPESLVRWNEPDVEHHFDGDALRLQWALQAIGALARTPIPDGDLLARYATIGGVAAARLRDRAEARRLFRLARQAVPDVSKHWVRWAVACIPPAADRVWEPTDELADQNDRADESAQSHATAVTLPGAEPVPDRTLLAR